MTDTVSCTILLLLSIWRYSMVQWWYKAFSVFLYDTFWFYGVSALWKCIWIKSHSQNTPVSPVKFPVKTPDRWCFCLLFHLQLSCSSLPAVLGSNLVLKELSSVQWVNSKELAFTWLSRCCYGREARQRRKKPLSLCLSHIPIFSLSLVFSFPPPLLSPSFSHSAREPSWLENQTTNESTQLSLSPSVSSFFK